MRLLIDAQCIQSTSSLRGIGRYALSLTRAIVREAGENSVDVLLNGGDDMARALRARAALESFLPSHRIHVFDAAWPWSPTYDDRRRPAAEAAYAAAVRSIGPDALLVGSLFEGDRENVLSVRASAADPPVATVLYDLIPALDPKTYLMGPGASSYWRRFAQLERCDALLAISRHSGAQAHQLLQDRCPPVTPIWGGPYPSGDFPAFEAQRDDADGLALPERFVLSVGGDHPRKNLDRLVEAWGRVPAAVRSRQPLVLACRLNPGTVRRLRRIARRAGLAPAELVLTGGVAEATLQRLYADALAFVFPSLEEGLGMPPLEAMAAGCPTLLARGSSLSELADDAGAFFDPHDVQDMAAALTRVLSDGAARQELLRTAAATAELFTWRRSAQLTWQALEELPPPSAAAERVPAPPVRLSDAAAVTRLAADPAPVLLDAPLPASRRGVLGLPVAARASLAPATSLLVPTTEAGGDAVRAGLLDQPVVVGQTAPEQVRRHDFYAEYADGLAQIGLEPAEAARVTAAVATSPRWMLERPRPVWLLVTQAELPPTSQDELAREAGVDIVVTGPLGVRLGACVDVVLVSATDVGSLLDELARVRRRGARVVAMRSPLDDAAVPDWCDDVEIPGPLPDAASWLPLAAAWATRWGRTTGWPWRARG